MVSRSSGAVRRLLSGDRRPKTVRLLRPRESEISRRRRRVLAGLVTGLGLVIAALGVAAPRFGADTAPRPLAAGQVVRVPASGPFGGVVAVYAQANADRPPAAADLACVVSTGTVTAQGVGDLDRLVLAGVAVTPVLRLVAVPQGAAMRCDGSVVESISPLYVVARPGVETLVPMAAFSVASLLCVLGIAGVVLLRSDAA
jgi:hypothetical protein